MKSRFIHVLMREYDFKDLLPLNRNKQKMYKRLNRNKNQCSHITNDVFINVRN